MALVSLNTAHVGIDNRNATLQCPGAHQLVGTSNRVPYWQSGQRQFLRLVASCRGWLQELDVITNGQSAAASHHLFKGKAYAYVHRRIAARRQHLPCVIDGAINAESVDAWVDLFLIPTLEPSIIVLDDLGSHQGRSVRKLLKAAGKKFFFLSPYSSDLNPIEEMFSKLKRLCARPMSAPSRRLAAHRNFLAQFPPAACANYILGKG